MPGKSQDEDLIKSFLFWVEHKAPHKFKSYVGLWDWMTSANAHYCLEDFEQDLWQALLSSGAVELTGNMNADWRSRGFYRVLKDAIRLRNRERKYKYVRIDVDGPDGKERLISQGPLPARKKPSAGLHSTLQEGRLNSHDALDLDIGPLLKRKVILRLATLNTDEEFEAADLLAPHYPPAADQDTAETATHISIARRNWWRAMND